MFVKAEKRSVESLLLHVLRLIDSKRNELQSSTPTTSRRSAAPKNTPWIKASRRRRRPDVAASSQIIHETPEKPPLSGRRAPLRVSPPGSRPLPQPLHMTDLCLGSGSRSIDTSPIAIHHSAAARCGRRRRHEPNAR
ncbi:uncharacterized protein V6R79_001242 [Siganus canaliculatus]